MGEFLRLWNYNYGDNIVSAKIDIKLNPFQNKALNIFKSLTLFKITLEYS